MEKLPERVGRRVTVRELSVAVDEIYHVYMRMLNIELYLDY